MTNERTGTSADGTSTEGLSGGRGGVVPPGTDGEGEAGPGSGQPRTVADAGTREMTPLTGSVTAAPDDARQLEAEIERTREQLGQTVQELAARADVKSRARAKATEVSDRLKGTAAQVRGDASARAKSVRSQVATKTGAARRQAASAGGVVTKGARDYWMPVAMAAGVIALDYVALSQWRSGR